MEKRIKLPQLSLEQIIENEISFPYTDFRPLPLFKEYLNRGYYPFYKEDNRHFHDKLLQVVKQVLDVDLPKVEDEPPIMPAFRSWVTVVTP